MGDHRASIKIEMEFHGVKDSCPQGVIAQVALDQAAKLRQAERQRMGIKGLSNIRSVK